MEIKHFSHEHPLMFIEDHQKVVQDEDGKLRCCHGCTEPIFLTPSYNCSIQHCKFWLHKSCAELPKKIKHPLHLEHPLILRPKAPYFTYEFICCGCGSQRPAFVYHCSLCSFDLDVGCASMGGHKIKHPSHHHPLAPLGKKILALCDACGTTHQEAIGVFYQCTTCVQFWIHRECASLPIKIQQSVHHHHPLTLAYSFPPRYSIFRNNYCDICNKRVKSQYWIYYCGPCRYFAHVNCATSIPLPSAKDHIPTKDEDTYLDVVHLPVPDETVSLVSHFSKGMIIERTTYDDEVINHFSHDHPLILFRVQGDDSKPKLCEACVKPISVAAPFYKCSTTTVDDQCNFFLHKYCAELPTKVRHPCHPQHPLILLPKSPQFFNLFLCQGCFCYCNGFTYSCADCKYYYLDVECGSLPSTIKHEAHKNHLLSLRNKFSSHCNVCDKNGMRIGFSYGCGTCSFEVHASCALSPRTIRHRYDELHPFFLTYSPVQHYSDDYDYYCDICETELNPKWWFYHCAKCDKSMHPTCVPPFDQWSRIKFGGTLSIKTHPHPLTLVPMMGKGIQCNSRQVITQGTKCDHCTQSFGSCESIAFKCFQCYFKLKWFCGKYLD